MPSFPLTSVPSRMVLALALGWATISARAQEDQEMADSPPAGDVEAAAPGAEAAPPADLDVTFGLSVGVGTVSYSEDVSQDPIDSDWEGTFLALRGTAGVEANRMLIRGALELWGSGEDTEEWSDPFGVRQRNDMDVAGVELMGEVGYLLVDDQGTRVEPAVGFSVRGQSFTRSNFNLVREGIQENFSVDEDFSLAALHLSLTVVQRLAERLDARFRSSLATVVHYEAENDFLEANIEGDGGEILEVGGGLVYHLSDSVSLFAEAHYDLQDLEGGRTQKFLGLVQIELPDNELERFQGRAGLLIAL